MVEARPAMLTRTKVLITIYDHASKNAHGDSPTVREIAVCVEKSRATVQGHINRLFADGYINKRRCGIRRSRNYMLTESGCFAVVLAKKKVRPVVSDERKEYNYRKGDCCDWCRHSKRDDANNLTCTQYCVEVCHSFICDMFED